MTEARRGPTTIPSDRQVEDVVIALRAIDHKTAWERVLEIGRLVFDGILSGDEEGWRSRRSQKNVSLRKLVEHERCPFKKSALCAAINIHLFVKAEPLVPRIPGITPTHVAQTLTLERPQALTLLSKASHAGWSVRDLGQTVRSLRREAGERRGRPVSSEEGKASVMGRRALSALREMHEHLSACTTIGDDSLRAVLLTLQQVSDLVTSIHELPGMSRRSGLILVAKVARTDEPGTKTA